MSPRSAVATIIVAGLLTTACPGSPLRESTDANLMRATDVTTRFEPGQQEVSYDIRIRTNEVATETANQDGPVPWFGGFIFKGASPLDEPVNLTSTMSVNGQTFRREPRPIGPETTYYEPPSLSAVTDPCPVDNSCEQRYRYTFRLSKPWHEDEPLRLRWRFFVRVEFPPTDPLPEGASMEAWLDGHPIRSGQ